MLAKTDSAETHKNTMNVNHSGQPTVKMTQPEPSDYELTPFELWVGNRLIDILVIGAFIIRPENIARIKIILFGIAFFISMFAFSIWVVNKSLGY